MRLWIKGFPSGRIRIHLLSASPFSLRHSPRSSSLVRKRSTRTGLLYGEKTSKPTFGSTPFSPRSIFTAILPVPIHWIRDDLTAATSPCQPIAVRPVVTESQSLNIMTSRIISSSLRLVIVPTCLTVAPAGSWPKSRSNAGRSFFARSSPRNGGSILSNSSL